MRKLVMILKSENGYFDPKIMLAWVLGVAVIIFIIYKLNHSIQVLHTILDGKKS